MSGVEWFLLKDKIPPLDIPLLMSDGEFVIIAEFWDKNTSEELGIGSHKFSGYEWDWDFENKEIKYWAFPPNPPKVAE